MEGQAEHDNFNTKTRKQRQLSILHDNNRKIITEIEKKLEIWKNYITLLFEDERRQSNMKI